MRQEIVEEVAAPTEARWYTVLLPIGGTDGAADLIRLATALIGRARSRAIALGIVEVPEERNFSEAAALVQEQRRSLRSAIETADADGVVLKTIVRTAREAWAGIQQTARDELVDLVLLNWDGAVRAVEGSFGTTIDRVVQQPPADIAVVKPVGSRPIRRILLPVRGGPHAALALRLALNLADAHDAIVTVLNIDLTGPTLRRAIDIHSFAEFSRLLPESPRLVRKTVAARLVEDAILAEAADHDVVVMGASARPPGAAQFRFGEIPEAIASKAEATVIVVKTREPIDLHRFEVPAQPIAVVVDKWFAENTFHSREFAHVEELVELKRRQGLTISLGLPTLNEEQTIGPIVKTLRQELVERVPLLDEIAVIDSGSTDRTLAIAAELGVPAYRHAETLAEHAAGQTKGVAIWKSLYLLKGDILVWLTSDIKNIHPKFVYGLVGPLLREPRVAYVKGFYRRPIRIGHEFYNTGGGQLTELTMRPLVNLFFPELSGLVEPLSGEHAGRRRVLERLPAFAGNGVLFGLLVDVLDACGLQAIAQSDLEERIHRTREVPEQTETAFSLIQVAIKRLEGRKKVQLLEEVNTTMKLIRYEPDRFFLQVRDIHEVELPPMVNLPTYRLPRAL